MAVCRRKKFPPTFGQNGNVVQIAIIGAGVGANRA
jgi:hypothetical protein